jgi:competence protein ComEA
MDRLKGLMLGLALFFFAFGASAEPIDINTATAEQIDAGLTGVGKAKAAAIVQDREKNGPFKSVDDLKRVKGIKAATIAKNRDKISVGAAAPVAATPAAPTKTPAPATPPPTPK